MAHRSPPGAGALARHVHAIRVHHLDGQQSLELRVGGDGDGGDGIGGLDHLQRERQADGVEAQLSDGVRDELDGLSVKAVDHHVLHVGPVPVDAGQLQPLAPAVHSDHPVADLARPQGEPHLATEGQHGQQGAQQGLDQEHFRKKDTIHSMIFINTH